MQAKFIHRCNAFFMEIVSLFCFGDDVRNLDPDVFEMLMRYVTRAHSAGAPREFSIFPEFGADSSPVVRSFLLQQLINSRCVFLNIFLMRLSTLFSKYFADTTIKSTVMTKVAELMLSMALVRGLTVTYLLHLIVHLLFLICTFLVL